MSWRHQAAPRLTRRSRWLAALWTSLAKRMSEKCPNGGIARLSLLKIQIGANEGGDKQRAALPILRSSTLVAMMQAADLREGDNVLAGGG
jgi:hypothetical protein